jgi:hypothetical protein
MAMTEWAIYIETRRPDGTRERCEIGAIRRNLSAPVPDDLGLRLAETKGLLQQLQLRMIEGQIEQSATLDRRCCRCGLTRPLHDRRRRVIQTLFGTVPVRQPRLRPCPCGRSEADSSGIWRAMQTCVDASERARHARARPYPGRAWCKAVVPRGRPCHRLVPSRWCRRQSHDGAPPPRRDRRSSRGARQCQPASHEPVKGWTADRFP